MKCDQWASWLLKDEKTKKYNILSIAMLFADGMLRLLAHWEWGHVLGIFFAWVAPSGLGTTALCPCPGVLHPNYVLAISRDVGKASGCSVTFSPGLLTGSVCVCVCVYMSVYTCVQMCSHGFLLACRHFKHSPSLLFCFIFAVSFTHFKLRGL